MRRMTVYQVILVSGDIQTIEAYNQRQAESQAYYQFGRSNVIRVCKV